MRAQSIPPSRRAPQDRRARLSVFVPDPILWFLQRAGSACQTLYAWLQASSMPPYWLPARWRRPWMGYLLALLSSIFFASITLLLTILFPALNLKGVLLIGGIVLIALTWGAGPSLLATFVSTWLLEFVVIPLQFSWQFNQPGPWVDGGIHLASWIGVSLLASQSGWARRKAEALAGALHQAEREAAARAREAEAIFDALTDGLVVYDAEGRILRSNTAARQLLGFDAHPEFSTLPWKERAARYTPRDAEGQPVPPEDLALSRLLRGEVLTGAQTAEDCLHTPDGREVSFSMTGQPLHSAEGTLIGAVGIVRDVTERRRLERQTREALDALLAMAEALVQGDEQTRREAQSLDQMLQSGADPALVGVAARMAELTRRVLGCRYVGIAAVEPETRKMTPITIVGVSPRQEEQWWASWGEHSRLGQHLPPGEVAALQAGEPVLVNSLQRPFPRARDIVPGSSSVLVPMRVGETLVGLLRVDGGMHKEECLTSDRQALIRAVARLGALVLERQRLLRERAEAQANELALRETQAQMETFLGIAGHELKNPLTSIKLSLQLTERHIRRASRQGNGAACDPASFLEQVARAGNQANRLERLVNELLDASRVRAGKLDFHLEPANLAAIVEEAVEEQRQANPDRSLVLHLPPERAAPVVADADRIGQVVTNYLTNALKYSPADCPVAAGLDVEDRQARVWVRDEGPGLPPEEQERIWERFHRARGIEVQSGTGVGLGLGLHICRTIIERHDGQVGVESAPGQGSTFWFTLPLGEQATEDLT